MRDQRSLVRQLISFVKCVGIWTWKLNSEYLSEKRESKNVQVWLERLMYNDADYTIIMIK